MGSTRARGVTLAEIVVALGVASIALLALAVFISTIHRAVREGKSQAAASTVARRILEKLRSDPDFYRAVQEDPGGYEEEQLVWQAGEIVPTRFRVQVVLTPLAGADNYADTTVWVRWLEEHRQREVVLETYLPVP